MRDLTEDIQTMARRACGCKYFRIQDEQRPAPAVGLPEFPAAIKAWEKARGRLFNGEENQVSLYIEGYKEHIAIGRTKPGYHVAIV